MKNLIRNLKYPQHCEHCEGISDVENPRHHPSYEITLECNLDCIFCYSRIAKAIGYPNPGYYGDLKPKAITVSQFGEPLLVGEKEIIRISRTLREIFGEVRLDLQTNGVLLTPKICQEFDIVMISLDAGSRESYRRITKRDYFEKVVENIKMCSKITHTTIRTVYIPGLNDDELKKIAEIASNVEELFIQPISIYRENRELIEKIDVERAESIGDFLRKVLEIHDICNVRIPGCFLLNLEKAMKYYDFDEILLFSRNAFAEFPTISREWRFKI
ncbi:MAG: radical SAM protein [Archaeoglobaceae archaeon]|nr:radical SAM protein [Archaeoglobaceae archaeon]